MSGPGADVYTFGDSPVAAARLALLAEVFEDGTRDLIARWAPARVDRAVDLGCGLGHTTRLLHRVSGAATTIGVERSAEYLELARRDPVPGVSFVGHDVTADPIPVPPADLVLARFLLTHLGDPAGAVRLWAGMLAPGGRLLLQETARLVSREPALGRYYELVGQLQHEHGQALDVGAGLTGLAAGSGLTVVHSGLRSLRPPVASMAALHVLNLRTWRHDPVARGLFDPDELDGLDDALSEIAAGRAGSAPIEQDLGELVVQL